MKLASEGILLRVFLGESDTYRGTSLYEKIVLKAREMDLAGATVLRGMMGYGANSHIHTSTLLPFLRSTSGCRDRGYQREDRPDLAFFGRSCEGGAYHAGESSGGEVCTQ